MKLTTSRPEANRKQHDLDVLFLTLYRAALDAIKKLDEILKQKKAYRDVFLQDAVGLRNK